MWEPLCLNSPDGLAETPLLPRRRTDEWPLRASASADMPDPKPVRNRLSTWFPERQYLPLDPLVRCVEKRTKGKRGQRPPAAPDSNKKSRKATLVTDEPSPAAFAFSVVGFSQNYKSLKQISNESGRILTQRISRVKQKLCVDSYFQAFFRSI
jgi:hypothetical protein